MVVVLYYVKLAERASRIYVQPFIYAAAMEMVPAWEFTQLYTILVGTEADAALLQVEETDWWHWLSCKKIKLIISSYQINKTDITQTNQR